MAKMSEVMAFLQTVFASPSPLMSSAIPFSQTFRLPLMVITGYTVARMVSETTPLILLTVETFVGKTINRSLRTPRSDGMFLLAIPAP